jgi:thioredoxin 1
MKKVFFLCISLLIASTFGAKAQKVVELNDTTFKEMFRDDIPVLVHFYSHRSEKASQMKPIIQKLAEEYAGKVMIAQVNIDENENAVRACGIDSTPTMLYFKRGLTRSKLVCAGVCAKESIEAIIK